MKILMKTGLCFLLMICGGQAYANSSLKGREIYNFDKSHTNIMWFVDHIGFSDSMGQFMEYEGQIILDHDAPERSSVTITINTASIMTGLPNFDAHLKNDDFFQVDKFPTAKYVSNRVLVKSDNRATVEGTFTLLGKTRPLVLEVRLNKRAMDIRQNKIRAGFSVKTVVKRSDWGMTKYLGFVGDDVKIRIEAEALVTQ